MKTVVLSISAALASFIVQPAFAQTQPNIAAPPAGASAATGGEIQQLQTLHGKFPEPSGQDTGGPQPPTILQQLDTETDDEGQVSTYQPGGQTVTASNPFFRVLGTNGRTCFTCHQLTDGMGLGQANATNRFAADPNEPLFRLVDGATCPDDDVSTPAAMAQAYSLLTAKGLIRINLPLSSSFQFQIVNVQDTNGSDCNTNPNTGVTGPQSGAVNFYRRPLPATNLGSESNIMWDAREPSLAHQALDATLGHAQASVTPADPLLNQIVSFESGLYDAQSFDTGLAGISVAGAGDLTGADGSGATGGAQTLAQTIANFVTGINDPFGGNFNPAIFNIYDAWANLTGTDPTTQARQAIYRGEQVFNTAPMQITGVAGLNDVQGKPTITGTCGTCHSDPNVGNASSNVTMDTGVTDASPPPPDLDISGLPVFTVLCTAGPDAGQTFTVTDIGVGMISGQCADIGKTKVPAIRGIAARSPYFHNGAALEITNLVQFYNARFNMNLTAQQQSDLEVFLEAQ
jgi:hypothetical protein